MWLASLMHTQGRASALVRGFHKTPPGYAREPARPAPAATVRAHRHLSDRLWGCAWVPLHSIRSVVPTGVAAAGPPAPFYWTSRDAWLSDELVKTSVLPFLTAADLLQTVQPLSEGHARLGRSR